MRTNNSKNMAQLLYQNHRMFGKTIWGGDDAVDHVMHL